LKKFELNIKDHFECQDFIKMAVKVRDELGFDVFIVGGYVRDFLLKRETNEIDYLIVGDGPEFANRFAKKLKVKKIVVYRNFGTAHFKYKGNDFEFVGARKESYSKDSRDPVVLPGTFEDDIKRRDFTINTLAISLNDANFGEIVDLFEGMKDIQNRIIKTPLDPENTFDDDPLRILRAFRFAAQLDFEVDNKLINAAKQNRDRLKIIAQERITDEFYKILKSPAPSLGLKLCQQSSCLEIIFPELSQMSGVEQRKDHHHKDVFLHTCEVVDNIADESNNLWLRFAALVHDIAKPTTKKFINEIGWTFHAHEEIGARMMKKIFKRMKFPLSKLEYVEKLIRLHLRPIALVNEEVTDSAIRRFIVCAGEDLEDLITLCRADITSKNPKKVKQYLKNYDIVMQKVRDVLERDRLKAFQSPVRGDVIMEICKIPPSKLVGEIKSAIEEAILNGKIKNTYDSAYEYLLKIKDQYMKK